MVKPEDVAEAGDLSRLNDTAAAPIGSVVTSQQGPDIQGGPCPTCGNTGMSTAASFVYALGRVQPRFPRLSVEKEFAQATSQIQTANLTDRQVLHAVLAQSKNRYLARQICWVLSIESIDTYILQPRDPADLDPLIESIRPSPRATDVDIVIGLRGPLAPPELCGGLVAPLVFVDQIYSFDIDGFVKAIPKPQNIAAKAFGAAAEELFTRIIQLADNAGATDDHRALNYVGVRYPAIYALAADLFARDCSLTSVDVRPSRLSGTRNIVDVIFSYTNRRTDVTDKYFCRVDVSEEFPFLVTKLQSFYDRP